MVAGPGIVGSGVASADLLGIDVDILDLFGDDKKDDKKSDPHPVVRAQQNGGGAAPERRTTAIGDDVGVPQHGLVESVGGGGGGGAPRSTDTDRAASLPPVPTAPSSRSVVIRAEPPIVVPAAPAVPVAVPPPVIVPLVLPPPIVVPLAPVVAPLVPAPQGPPAPNLPVIPQQPQGVQHPPTTHRPIPADVPGSPELPASFRAGYADSLRAADVGQLLVATMPGVAGMLTFTAAGGLLGYRQARAARMLPPANIARFLQ
jgi:hypothetical protein